MGHVTLRLETRSVGHGAGGISRMKSGLGWSRTRRRIMAGVDAGNATDAHRRTLNCGSAPGKAGRSAARNFSRSKVQALIHTSISQSSCRELTV